MGQEVSTDELRSGSGQPLYTTCADGKLTVLDGVFSYKRLN